MSDFQRVSTGLHPRGANPVHLDHAATTPVDPRVIRRMLPYLTQMYGDPASRSHAYGWVGEEAVELAREQVSSLVNADPHEIVWTSGATESNNPAIKGAAHLHRAKGNPLVTLTTEHQSVLTAMLELDRDDFEVSVLPVQESGLVDLAVFEAALQPGAVLASVMFVNNETGVIQDIAAIGAPCRAQGILPHVDAAQAAGKVPIDLPALPVDLMSFSAHRIDGPKDIGALYVGLGRACGSRVKCTAASTSAACARGRCARIRSSRNCHCRRSRSTARFSPRTRSRRPCLTFARTRRFETQQPTTCNSPSNRPARLTRSESIQA
ncbi:cysteine sulfinate desulfinase/cysteine desulfurase-like protein [Paraburkholderia sp. WSM4179]|nr:cysteine sulfinate desulfinase/cysteine desulfurase-like protein [Paraburkholderia sp. WSM4179]